MLLIRRSSTSMNYLQEHTGRVVIQKATSSRSQRTRTQVCRLNLLALSAGVVQSGTTPHRYGVSGVRLVCGGGGPWLLVAWTRVVLCTPLGGLPLVCWPGFVRVSQSEDQSRPHPARHFVHPMSTQVRDLDPDAAEGGPRSDPQIATESSARHRRGRAYSPLLTPRQVPNQVARRCGAQKSWW